MFEKTTSVNFVGSDPRLLEIGAKWRTHWAIILKVKKKIKSVRGLAQEAQPSDLYPYARKSDNFVGSDPRLMDIGAKWRTHWAIILKVKKQ